MHKIPSHVIQDLRSSNLDVRLKAARSLTADQLSSGDIRILEAFIKNERNPWVKTALSLLVRSAHSSDQSDTESNSESIDDNYTDRSLITDALEIMSHEILPRIGRVELAAEREIDNYTSSDTKTKIDSIRQAIDALQQLRSLDAKKTISQVNISELLSQICTDYTECDIHMDGDQFISIQTDAGALQIILENAIRNSVEACNETPQPHRSEIVIAWGSRISEAWITIIDNGPGLPDSIENLLPPGASTKSTDINMGLGLALVAELCKKIGAKFSLTNRAGGGAKFTMEIKKQ